MYAIIETGGKQYRVEPGDVLDVELTGEEDEDKIEFDRVLMVGGDDDDPRLGTPVVEGASVAASPIGNVRGRKVLVFKRKRRKGYRRLNGHRQDLVRVRIDSIDV